MNQYVTGTIIKELRERQHMTQADKDKDEWCEKNLSLL